MRRCTTSRHAHCVRSRCQPLVLVVFLSGCIGTPPSESTAPTSHARTETSSPAQSVPSPNPAAALPLPTGARVPEAGTIYLILGSELIRYDGTTGTVTDVGHRAEFSRGGAVGAHVVPNGGSRPPLPRGGADPNPG